MTRKRSAVQSCPCLPLFANKIEMDSIHVTLPDGKSVEVQRGTRIDEIAPSNATNGNIIAAKVDGRPVDLSRRLDNDCSLAWVSIDSPDGIDVLRHSTAHLMAQAVQSLFPGTQVTIGPTIEDGFYYDFKRDRAFTPEEIEKIEARMEEIAKSNLKVTREEMPRSQAIELFRGMGEDYKVAIIEDLPDEKVSLYRQGDWVDLCRGPHVPSTGVSKPSSSPESPAPIGAAMRKTRCFSASMVRHGPPSRRSRSICDFWKKRRSATIASWDRNWICLCFHPLVPDFRIWLPKGAMVYTS